MTWRITRSIPSGARLSRMQQLILLGFLFLIIITLVWCGGYQAKPQRINRGFYYWKSTFRLNRVDKTNLSRLGVSRMFIKFFDVTWSNGPMPVSAIRFINRPPENVQIVPTVFITNDTLQKLASNSVTDLAHKIAFKIRHIGEFYALPAFDEVQLDCDWTDSTRQKYFGLLQQLKEEWQGKPVKISATIRLHQIKYYRRTGVPPVDRGVLMFYNMADLTDYDTANSILDVKIARQYIANLKCYPLSLDVALPLFSWGAVFQDRRFIGLARGYRRSDLQQPDFEPYRGGFYRAKADVYRHGTQLYRGDLIRVEESTYAACRESAALLKRSLRRNTASRVLFFDFDQAEIGVMGIEKLDQIYRSFD